MFLWQRVPLASACASQPTLKMAFALFASPNQNPLQTAEGEENEFKGCLEVSDMRRREMDGSLKPEPMLIENPGRFVLFPIQDDEVCFSIRAVDYVFLFRDFES